MTVEDEARAELMDDTRWNGMPIEATRGTAIVAPAPEFEHYWAQGLIGFRIPVVRVSLDGATQVGGIGYLDDRDEQGWWKVTHGGTPMWPHSSVTIVPDSFVAAVPGGES